MIKENHGSTGFIFHPVHGYAPYKEKTIIHFIGKNSDHQTIIMKAEHISEAEHISSSNSIFSKMKQFCKNFYSIRLLYKIMINNNYYKRIFNINKKSLDQIILTYGKNNITVIQFPEKDEVIRGKYDKWGKKARSYILSYNIKYIDGLDKLKLNKKDFHKNDSHPNAAGYYKIFELAKYELAELR